MCFTPKISLATAIFEFLVSAFIYLRYQKSHFPRFVALFIFILGFYQFTEFMMCYTGDVNLWGKIGFITYTFLPAVGLHLVLSYTHQNFIKKFYGRIAIYLPMVIFILVVVFSRDFIISGFCGRFFVSIKNYFYSGQNPLAEYLYLLYYFGYITAICVILFWQIYREKNKQRVLIYLTIIITTFLAILPPIILLGIFPAINYQFPSVYCQFAVLYAVFALFGVYLDNKQIL